ncbi:Ger(x)C family spore germination protein [Lysinibacillus yapensis]|uniref:Ger(x)C family spore germination protein n=1 Tax=Ureibacillus yapensis TaxID=2304605 RepID=UPI001F4678FB|nr:Ger(x)C family spore germination protein [Lysinibacillus yapensis]
MNRKKVFILLLSVTLFLFGCAQTRILERISLVTLVGYDQDQEDNVKATAVIRQINPNYESSIETQSETEHTSKGARTKLDMRTAKQLMIGQLRVVLFGEELAKSGLDEAIHTLMMNSEISTSTYLAVVEGETKPMIEYKYETITDIGQYLYNLLKHNIEQQQSISSTLHEVVRDKYSPYREFAMPLLKKEGEHIQINGVAFFNNGKMVGRLPADDIYYVVLLSDSFKHGTLELEIPSDNIVSKSKQSGNLQIAVDSIETDRRFDLVSVKPAQFDISINMKCRLLEIDSNVPIGNHQVIKKVEKAMSKKMEEEINRIFKYSQQVNSDIFGFGEVYKSHLSESELKNVKWNELYPDIKAKIQVNVDIIRNGTFE